MNTEMSDAGNAKPGWICFDADCRACATLARRFDSLLARGNLHLVPLQAEWIRQRLGISETTLLTELSLITEDGRRVGGARAVLEIARRIWWAWPIFALSRIPRVEQFLDRTYRWIASRRHCLNGACHTPRRGRLADWVPLILGVPAAFAIRGDMPDWVFMWVLAFALYAGCKWLVWRRAIRDLQAIKPADSVAFLFGWTGMDAKAFLGRRLTPLEVRNEALMAGARVLFGLILVSISISIVLVPAPHAAAWSGMVGIVLCLHFGLFTLLDLLWRRLGFNAPLLMRAPLRATSLAEFWGRRWNTGFHRLAHEFVYRPIARRLGVAGATVTTFLVSGLIHDLVISVPARGGYGLPTLYFLLQGSGVLLERTSVAKRLGCGQEFRGWLFAIIFAAGPVVFLFHPAFVQNVILPMLGALRNFAPGL